VRSLGLWPENSGLAGQDALVVLICLTIAEFCAKQAKLREKK
jgi:hypothetical protein